MLLLLPPDDAGFKGTSKFLRTHQNIFHHFLVRKGPFSIAFKKLNRISESCQCHVNKIKLKTSLNNYCMSQRMSHYTHLLHKQRQNKKKKRVCYLCSNQFDYRPSSLHWLTHCQAPLFDSLSLKSHLKERRKCPGWNSPADQSPLNAQLAGTAWDSCFPCMAQVQTETGWREPETV